MKKKNFLENKTKFKDNFFLSVNLKENQYMD